MYIHIYFLSGSIIVFYIHKIEKFKTIIQLHKITNHNSLSLGFFYFFRRSKQFEYDPKAKTVTRIMKTNTWLQCKEPLNSSSDFTISEGKVYSGVEMFHYKNLNFLIFSIVHMMNKIYSYQ